MLAVSRGSSFYSARGTVQYVVRFFMLNFPDQGWQSSFDILINLVKSCCLPILEYNECMYINGGCSHGCVNDPAGHQCTCPEPLHLDDNGFTCKGMVASNLIIQIKIWSIHINFHCASNPNEKFWGIWTTDTHENTYSIILSTQRNWLNRFIMIFTDCGPPPNGLGLRISNTILRGTSSGAEVRYECNEIGYALNGTGTSICRLDGTWSDTPTCQSKAFIILHKVKVTLKKRTTPKKWE